MSYQCTEEQFLKEVTEHQMTVFQDEDVYRRIRFSKPGTSCMHFDLITWPGYLCYTGDMGTFVFSRLPDMFKFFRGDQAYNESKGRMLSINLQYWAEKLEAVDRNGGVKAYDADKFKQCIKEWLDNHDASAEVREAVKDEVLSRADDGADRAMNAAYEFRHAEFVFQDIWEFDPTEYTHRFVWCCYALAWGILQYDKSKEVAPS